MRWPMHSVTDGMQASSYLCASVRYNTLLPLVTQEAALGSVGEFGKAAIQHRDQVGIGRDAGLRAREPGFTFEEHCLVSLGFQLSAPRLSRHDPKRSLLDQHRVARLDHYRFRVDEFDDALDAGKPGAATDAGKDRAAHGARFSGDSLQL